MTRSIDGEAMLEQEALRFAEYLREEEKAPEEWREDFAEWVRRSPEHLYCLYEELGIAEALGVVRAARGEEAAPQEGLAHWVAVARRELESTSEVEAASGGGVMWLRVAAVAAICVVPSVLAAWSWTYNAPYTEHVTLSEPRTMTLRDGSDMTLGPNSVARVRYSWAGRDVQLVKGDADFKVRHDMRWPFDVDYGVAIARALGTRFHVRRGGGAEVEPEMNVTEGLVRVTLHADASEAVEVSAGNKAIVTADGRIKVMPMAASETAVLASSRVSFEKKTLGEIVTVFNERKHLPRMVVEGAACGLRLTAVLDVNNPEELLALLRQMKRLAVSLPGDVVRIRDLKDSSSPGAHSAADCAAESP